MNPRLAFLAAHTYAIHIAAIGLGALVYALLTPFATIPADPPFPVWGFVLCRALLGGLMGSILGRIAVSCVHLFQIAEYERRVAEQEREMMESLRRHRPPENP